MLKFTRKPLKLKLYYQLWLRSIKYGSLGGKAEWRYSRLKVLMKSYLKLLFKCNTNRGVFTGYLAERVECGPSNHVVEGSILCTVTFFFIFFQLFFLIFSFSFDCLKLSGSAHCCWVVYCHLWLRSIKYGSLGGKEKNELEVVCVISWDKESDALFFFFFFEFFFFLKKRKNKKKKKKKKDEKKG